MSKRTTAAIGVALLVAASAAACGSSNDQAISAQADPAVAVAEPEAQPVAESTQPFAIPEGYVLDDTGKQRADFEKMVGEGQSITEWKLRKPVAGMEGASLATIVVWDMKGSEFADLRSAFDGKDDGALLAIAGKVLGPGFEVEHAGTTKVLADVSVEESGVPEFPTLTSALYAIPGPGGDQIFQISAQNADKETVLSIVEALISQK